MDKLLKKKELKFRKIMAASYILKTTREKVRRLKGDCQKNLKNNVRL